MFTKRQTRQRAVVAGLTAVAVLVGTFFAANDILGPTLQNAAYDFAITQYPAAVRNQITVVGIDDRTIQQYGRWPLPRQAYVDLLSALRSIDPSKQGPRVIAFDIGFYDPSDRPADDAALAAAIKDSGNVILAMQGAGSGIRDAGGDQYTTFQLPIPALRAAAAGLGAVNVHPDDDGRVRDAQLILTGAADQRYYALPLVAVARYLSIARQVDSDERGLRVVDGGQHLVLRGRAPLPDRVMPIDRGGAMPVYYAAQPATSLAEVRTPCTKAGEFCVISLADVVSGKASRDLFANRIVFVGAHSASALPDDYPVPNSAAQKMYGVEIWANTAQSIITNRYPVRRQSLPVTVLEILVVTLVGSALILRFRLFGFLGALVLLALFSLVALFGFGAQTSALLGNGPVEVPSLGYVIPSAFWWVIVVGYVLFEEQIALNRTQTTFGRFVTPAVARTILEREEAGKLGLGGEDRRVTVLFGDIRGFTTISEGMTPSTLLGHLNQYFDGMVDIVNRYEGTVNKYNGDNIMVIWGAPLEVTDEAKKAVECALEMQRWIQAERVKGGPDVSFGFGINTGHVVAGFLGAKGRMEYTVIGDTANVASRLTSSDIARRDQVACTAETLAELGGEVDAVDLGAVAVKGRAEPVRCYQVNRVGTIANPNPAPPPEVPIGKAAVAGFH